MHPTHAHAHAHARHEHQHSVHLNFPEASPPTLPTARRRGIACTLSLIALLLVLSSWRSLRSSRPSSPWRTRASPRACGPRRTAASTRPRSAAEPVVLGLWDERKSVTALQLIVCLSLALGVDENHIMVVPEGSFFYRVTITHEGAWVMEAINAEGSLFLDALNAQAARFGAQLVISHVAPSRRRVALLPLLHHPTPRLSALVRVAAARTPTLELQGKGAQGSLTVHNGGAKGRAAHGKLRIKLLRPSKAVRRHASWLYSQMRCSPPASRTNLRGTNAARG